MFVTLPQPVDDVLCFSKVDLIQRASDFVFHVLGRELSQWSQQTGTQAHTHLNHPACSPCLGHRVELWGRSLVLRASARLPEPHL